MNVIFLDIDGVLNSERYFAKAMPREWGIGHLDAYPIALLDGLATRTGAYVVISSAWRLAYPFVELQGMLRTRGLQAPIIGRTVDLDDGGAPGRVRAAEIGAWLESNAARASCGRAGLVERFVILDDLEDFGPLEPRCVRTRFEDGLLPEHVTRAEALLGYEPGCTSEAIPF